MTADSGYCSEGNLVYLREQGIKSYIKLQTHEKRKTKAYKEDIGKHYNMMYIVEGYTHYYHCHGGRQLHYIRTEKSQQEGYVREIEAYGCEDCSGCRHKAKCLYRYEEARDKDKNKVMKINETWVDLQADTHTNIQSEKGILNRQIRSIQTEGHFGDIKENERFRCFHYHPEEKVCKEFMLYAFGRNINKYHRFLYDKLQTSEGKKEQKAA